MRFQNCDRGPRRVAAKAGMATAAPTTRPALRPALVTADVDTAAYDDPAVPDESPALDLDPAVDRPVT
jgi:hypothetical protein